MYVCVCTLREKKKREEEQKLLLEGYTSKIKNTDEVNEKEERNEEV